MKRIILLTFILIGAVGLAYSQCVTNAGPDITICGGEEVGLGGIIPSGSAGVWVGGVGTFNPNRNDPLAVYTPDGSEVGTSIMLIINTSGGACPAGSDTMIINVINTPELYNLSGFLSNTCPTTSVDLTTANIVDSNNTVGVFTYYDSGFNLLPSTTVTTTGIYYVKKTSNSSPPCEDFVSVAVIINTCAGCSNPPSLSANVTNVTCNGDGDGAVDAILSGGVPPVAYQWSNGATTQDLSSISGGIYTVTVTDNENCSATLSVNVTEPGPINATITTNDPITFCRGKGPALLESTPDPTVTKQWLKFGNPINNATGDNYTTNFSGNYRLQVTNGGCTVLGNIIKITKLALPPVPTITALSSTQICVGDSVGLSCTTGPYTYGWVRRGQILTGEEDPVFYATIGGGYKAFVTDVNGCSRKSNKIDVIRTIRPTASITPTTAQLPSPICDGDTILLTSSIVGSTGPYTRQWYRYLAPLGGETNVTYTSTDFGGYSVRVTDTYGCTHQSARTIITETCRLGNTTYELTNNLHLAAYPNPFRNEVTLALNNFSNEEVRIIVRDALGKVIYESIESPQFEYRIQTGNYNPGLYIIELHQGSEWQRVKMLKSE